MIRSAFTLTILLTVLCKINAQNLVVNPGFEEFKKGLPVLADNAFLTYGVRDWYPPTEGSPDWYCNLDSTANPIPAGFSTNYWGGKADPHSGNCFGAFTSFSKHIQTNASYCEYAGGSLNNLLLPGHTYIFSFWIMTAPNSDMYHDFMGVYFSANKRESHPEKYDGKNSSNLGPLKVVPQLQIKIDTLRKWCRVQGEFVAGGGEMFFIIGNFTPKFDSSGKFMSSKRRAFHSCAYYYVDDFSLIDKNPTGPLTISAGQKLTFNNILFDTGKSSLLASSFSTLDQIVAALKKQPTLKVTINGHTDSDGDPQTNQTLSEQRALSVKKYFVAKGIDSTRITTKGFGSSQPLGTDKSKNRRMEFVFSH